MRSTAARNYAPLWITDGKANARAKAAIAYLGQVDADGLDPADYPVPNFASLSDPAALAEAEIRLTTSVITYAHHAQIGRVHWSRVSGDIYYDPKPPDPAEVLAKHGGSQGRRRSACRLRAASSGLPRAQGKARRTSRRQGRRAARRRSPNGPALKIGMQDERVLPLRDAARRCAATATTYDKALAEAVKKFQQEHELKATGTLTAATVEALNGRQPDRPTDIILANHGALAVDAARSRQDLRDRQSSRFHAAGDARRQAAVEDEDRRRQAGHADADHDRGDEVHHGQSDLECAALDRRPRISCRCCSRTPRCWSGWG